MHYEKVKAKIRERGENQKAIIITKRRVRYQEKKANIDVVVTQADFLLKINERTCSVQVRDGNVNSELPDDLSVCIFILSKHRVALLEVDSEGNEVEWYFGGFDLDNSDMSILGCMEFGDFTSFVYCNQDTETPLIKMESALETRELKILFEAIYSLIASKKKEGREHEEMEDRWI